jgi:hypothetical protein
MQLNPTGSRSSRCAYLKAREANADERVEPGSSGNVYVCSSEKRFFMSVFFSENELY